MPFDSLHAFLYKSCDETRRFIHMNAIAPRRPEKKKRIDTVAVFSGDHCEEPSKEYLPLPFGRIMSVSATLCGLDEGTGPYKITVEVLGPKGILVSKKYYHLGGKENLLRAWDIGFGVVLVADRIIDSTPRVLRWKVMRVCKAKPPVED